MPKPSEPPGQAKKNKPPEMDEVGRVPFIYNADLYKVIDGDTIDFWLDLGFNVFTLQRVRLARVDTWEYFKGDHRDKGAAAKDAVEALIEAAHGIVLRTQQDKTGKYGRYIAEVDLVDAEGSVTNLNDWLAASEHVKVED